MKAIFIFWVILFLPSIFFAQVENKEALWTRIESPKGDLTFAVPSDFLIDKEDGQYSVVGSQNKATMSVSIEEDGKAKNRLVLMRRYNANTEAVVSRFTNGDFATEAEISRFTNGDFIGDVYKYENEKSLSMYFYIASSKAFYTIAVTAKDLNNSVLERFISSIRLDNRPLVKQAAQPNQKEETKVSVASLKTSPIVMAALKRKDSAKAEVRYDLKNEVKSEEDITKYSRTLIMLRKPRPSYTDNARQSGIQGTIKLKVVFRASGKIGDITVLSKLDEGLIKNAVDAARKIKFLPAEVDGAPVDISRIVEYSFKIY